ncbi:MULTISPECIES: SycD/LcrH family type III secretion system chaperone [unclassified Endozoicomonas]|uniref:SycD/LcrH family type III secretion system chaperone n=1 Tax=unclassified Endozoicomonas TaxID=2644528 RepID=UPI0021477278|nr:MULTISPECIES: SycD/LcrH family type III secretion system chaperone [unclassified Endozoicomonas]
MSKQPLQAPDTQELATITEYLLTGGTLAEANQMSEKGLESIYSHGYNQYQNGHFEEAARIFQYLCFYDHWNARNFLCLGSCQMMLKTYGQAIKTLEYAARMDISNPLAKVYMGDCYLALKERGIAEVVYKSALKDARKHQFTHLELERVENLLQTFEDEKGGQS